MRKIKLYNFIRYSFQNELTAYVVGLYLSRKLIYIGKYKENVNLKIIAFSAYRYLQDIEVLNNCENIALYSFDQKYLHMVNALFLNKNHVDGKEVYESNEALIIKHKLFVTKVIKTIRKRNNIDCAITANIHYKVEQVWSASCVSAGLPFVAIHKEFTVLDHRHIGWRIDKYLKENKPFQGSEILVSNNLAKELFVKGKICEEKKVHVVGLLRMDRLFNNKYSKKTNQKKQVTLFSFGHYSGGIIPNKRRSHYFSHGNEEGFVKLFEETHKVFFELALENPDVEFLIKPKNHELWWFKEIDEVIKESYDLNINSVKNISYSNINAPELIQNSDVVIGLNSTVLLESILIGRNTVIPKFAEALDKYSDNIYLDPFIDLFNVARSKTDLKQIITNGLKDDFIYEINEKRKNEMLEYYFGFTDGETKNRVVSHLYKISNKSHLFNED
tara:strand:- start:10419 stop:11750 length:1332 start_codon:yes stop_codon:yes gene_type:complete